MRVGVLCLCVLVFLFGCKKDYIENRWTEYKIKDGSHYSWHGYETISDAGIRFRVMFDGSCRYKTSDSLNQLDINKCYGFVEGLDVHRNSCRLGWRWSDSLEVFGYVYSDGKRLIEKIGVFGVGKDYEIDIRIDYEANKYVFKALGKTLKMSRGKVPLCVISRLYPYFGGNETAPHDISIYMQDLRFLE